MLHLARSEHWLRDAAQDALPAAAPADAPWWAAASALWEPLRDLGFRHSFGVDPRLVVGAGLAAIALAALWPRRRPSRLALTATVVVRGALIALVLAAAMQPVWIAKSVTPAHVLVMVDQSPSVDAARGAAALSRFESAVSLAGGQVVQRGFGGDSGWTPGATLTRLALGPEAARGAAPLVVWSDGNLSGEWIGLPATARPGPVTVGVLPGAEAPGFELTDFSAEASARDALRVQFAGRVERPGRFQVSLFLDGLRLFEREQTLGSGAFALTEELRNIKPGLREVVVRLSDGRTAFERAATVAIEAPLRILLLGPPEGFAARALAAQGLDVEPILEATLAEALRAQEPLVDALVIEGVRASALSNPRTLEALAQHFARGGGLVHLPGDARDALVEPEGRPFLDVLPLVGLEPPPLPAPPDPDPQDEAPAKEAPDASKAEPETRDVKTLGLVLLIDASASMKGLRLTVAKRAAVATAEALHPKDSIGVVAFSGRALPVLEMTAAGDRATVRDRIARIEADGPTDFLPALQASIDMLAYGPYAIRHVVLLSDGEPKPGALRPIVEEMRQHGITLSTVGCGPGFDPAIMSNLAAWGGGKFHPAYDPMELPQLLVVEAERLIAATGARRKDAEAPASSTPPDAAGGQAPEEGETAPPPAERLLVREAWPASWTKGLSLEPAPAMNGVHPTRWRERDWPALELENGQPFAAHARRDSGRVIAFAAPLEGPQAVALADWPERPALLAQAVRFVARDRRIAEYATSGTAVGRRVLVDVLHRYRRTLPDDLEVELVDASGRSLAASVEQRSAERFEFELSESESARLAFVQLRSPSAGIASQRGAAIALSAPRELEARGEDLQRLAGLADALGGSLRALPERGLEIPLGSTRKERPIAPWIYGLIVVLLCLDFCLQELRRARRRTQL